MKKPIKPSELKKRLDAGESLVIVDVRTAVEFNSGHIPGALHHPLTNLGSAIPGVESHETIVVVCQHGPRSGMACERLAATHSNLLDLVGGVADWRASGFEIEKAPPSPRSVDRQVHFVAGLFIVTAFTLAHFVNPAWIYLAALPAFGLMLDAFTGICPMTLIVKRCTWNAV